MESLKAVRPVPIGFTIVTPWDEGQKKSVFQKASIQVGAVEIDTDKYVGVFPKQGNVSVQTEKLSPELQEKFGIVDAILREINAEVMAGYPNAVELPEEPAEE